MGAKPPWLHSLQFRQWTHHPVSEDFTQASFLLTTVPHASCHEEKGSLVFGDFTATEWVVFEGSASYTSPLLEAQDFASRLSRN